jgi:hypothetical protein
MKVAIAWLLVLVVVSMIVLPHSFVQAKSKQEKAITKAIGRAVEGNWKAIDMVNISKFNDNSTLTVYNKTVVVVPPQPPNPPPNPPPTPSGNISKVCLVGDLKGSTVPNMMKANGCNYKIGLGDLGYASDLSYFKGLKFDRCVIGNHDSPEDGSSSIYQEALAYCGDHWNVKIGQSALILGFNTNGDISGQVSVAKNILQNSNLMTNVKTVVLVSHKNGHVFPNAHHPAEASALYTQLESIIPTGVMLYEISGHNHDNAAAPAKHWYIAGAGGRSFYACGQDIDWTFCDNTHVGYLELTIDNTNGNTAATFIK